MVIYTIKELAHLLNFELKVNRSEGGESYHIYKKIVKFEGNNYTYTLTESPPSVGFKNMRYRLSVTGNHNKNSTTDELSLSINAANLKHFNEEIRKRKHFLKIFRDEKIDNILNSED